MRTIKFKGKRIDNDEWVHGAIHPNGIFIYEEKQFTWVQIEPKTVGQFTGLLDIKRIGIYDGDIIKSKTGALHVIEYCEHTARFMAKMVGFFCNNPNEIGISDEWIKEFEIAVIGNIHDNQKLLKEWIQ